MARRSAIQTVIDQGQTVLDRHATDALTDFWCVIDNILKARGQPIVTDAEMEQLSAAYERAFVALRAAGH